MPAIYRFLNLDPRQTNLRTEVTAGLTTFMTRAYIIFVNPAILKAAGIARFGPAFGCWACCRCCFSFFIPTRKHEIRTPRLVSLTR